jgi:DNA-binding protein HU-beta
VRVKTKDQLMAALAERTGLERRECTAVYDALVALVETHITDGVSLPGLCRFRLVDRAARYRRNPHTGQRFLIKPHKALTVRVPRAVRARLAPLPTDCRVPAPESEPAAPTAPAMAAQPTVEWVIFACRACGAQLEASQDLRGRQAVCPACHTAVTVPLAPPAPAVESALGPATPGADTSEASSTTMRIELPDLLDTRPLRPRKFVVPRYRSP